ncbi:MAG: glycerol-3-phosphate responsive antiterminator [Lachnospiraceae bacterium]|nr:glycerol-3-phosphate responsive antiterminator [Lachnospiraceae bacterium]
MENDFVSGLHASSVIMAVKDDAGLKKCLTMEGNVVFILYGDICNISEKVETIKAAGKKAFVHIDLVTGLESNKDVSVDFIKKFTGADGIITTKVPLIKRAKELGMNTVLRFFALDSMANENIRKQTKAAEPDVIEVLPALLPRALHEIVIHSPVPVITGGLVSDKRDIEKLLKAGATCVSTTHSSLWI